MPPIIAILLALFTKEVYLSLFAGCALGALLVAEFHPWVAFDTLFNTMIDSVDFSILMFMILLGMVVMLMQESGGTRAYGEWAAKKLKSKRATLVATSLLGMCTKFAEVTLAVHFRERSATGEWVGGPMYYIKNLSLIHISEPTRH